MGKKYGERSRKRRKIKKIKKVVTESVEIEQVPVIVKKKRKKRDTPFAISRKQNEEEKEYRGICERREFDPLRCPDCPLLECYYSPNPNVR